MRTSIQIVRFVLLAVFWVALTPSKTMQAACPESPWAAWCNDPVVHQNAAYLCGAGPYQLCYMIVPEEDGCWEPAGVVCTTYGQQCEDINAHTC